MSRLSRFIRESHRRRVTRVAAIYIVGAWVVLQVADLAFPAFDIPEKAIRYVWIGIALGFPLALIFGWRFDIIGGRVVRTDDSTTETKLSLSRADYLILSAIAIVAVTIVVRLGSEVTDSQQPSDNYERASGISPASIAVLPFVNLSPDPDYAYFAEGLSEEILNALANVRGLQVIARTSSFIFKNQNVDIREIGRSLGVANVLEGSVRMAGETFRVTVQLVDSRNGIHRWSETYDRSTSDVFAVQDDIARNIVLALRDALSIDVESSYSVAATENPEAYRYYLRARALIRKVDLSDKNNFEQAIDYLKIAVELDPNFSDAFVALADANFGLSSWYSDNYMSGFAKEATASAKVASKTAIELAPYSSEAMRALGMISDNPLDREQAFRQATNINPNNANAYRELGVELLNRGIVEEGAALIRKSHRLDPLNHKTSYRLATALVMLDKLKEASVYFRLSSEQEAREVGEGSRLYEARLTHSANLPSNPSNLDFEEITDYWRLEPACAENYIFSTSSDSYTGQVSGYLVSQSEATGWCNTYQAISAKTYAGKYIRLAGMIKTRHISDYAKLWMNIFSLKDSLGFADGRPNFITKDSDWTKYELRLFVPLDAAFINIGAVLSGDGEMWMDDFRFEVSDTPDFN